MEVVFGSQLARGAWCYAFVSKIIDLTVSIRSSCPSRMERAQFTAFYGVLRRSVREGS